MSKPLNPNPFFRCPFANPQGRPTFPKTTQPARPTQSADSVLPEP